MFNRIALSSDENLIAFDSIGRENINEPIELRRKRWSAFVWLETLQLTFFGLQENMVGNKYAKQALDQQLKIILSDKVVFDLVCNRGFDPAFVDYCTRINEAVCKTNEAKVEASKSEIKS